MASAHRPRLKPTKIVCWICWKTTWRYETFVIAVSMGPCISLVLFIILFLTTLRRSVSRPRRALDIRLFQQEKSRELSFCFMLYHADRSYSTAYQGVSCIRSPAGNEISDHPNVKFSLFRPTRAVWVRLRVTFGWMASNTQITHQVSISRKLLTSLCATRPGIRKQTSRPLLDRTGSVKQKLSRCAFTSSLSLRSLTSSIPGVSSYLPKCGLCAV